VQRWDFFDFHSHRALGDLHVIGLLHGKPDSRAIAAKLAKPQRHIHGDGLLFIENIIKCLAGNAEQSSYFRPWPRDGGQNILAEYFPGVNGPKSGQEIGAHQ
jgi:hypothetical protein